MVLLGSKSPWDTVYVQSTSERGCGKECLLIPQLWPLYPRREVHCLGSADSTACNLAVWANHKCVEKEEFYYSPGDTKSRGCSNRGLAFACQIQTPDPTACLPAPVVSQGTADGSFTCFHLPVDLHFYQFIAFWSFGFFSFIFPFPPQAL